MPSITFAEHPAILKAKRQAKDNMSITQTFVLAHKARSKLSKEASKPDHDLRHLVLTANLLDSLMLHLSQVEQDQEAHFNSMVREEAATDVEMATATSTSTLGAISEDSELAFDYSDSESDSDDEEEEDDDDDSFVSGFPVYTSKPLITIKVTAESDDEEEEEDEEDDGFYALQRVPSRAPSLIEDGSDSDEDESNPPSPRQSFVIPALSEKERQSLVTTSFYDETEEETTTISYLDIHHQSTSLITAY